VRSTRQQAQVVYDGQGLPAQLDQDGWKIEYRDWYGDLAPPMPRKVFASRGDARVKMAIDHWSFDG
jgi:outer membrane lipoprotein LolB